MSDFSRVCIGIQARSTSTRFPRKVHQKLGDKTVLEHVIDACQGSAEYYNRNASRNRAIASVHLCIPAGDEIKSIYSGNTPIFEGPEHDVLSRYLGLMNKARADYMVRITADCPLIPSFVITKHIMCAVMNDYDYVSNVDEQCRTSADGWDCEVISKRLLEYTAENATDAKDREHVTPYIRSNPPHWIRRGIIVGFMDLLDVKLSLDTPEDFEQIKTEYHKLQIVIDKSTEIYGASHLHRF